eukprot:TRINITY_DN19136_c0_g4_i1.p1 TRINITY_DN19136_c0_g4~~TRINITY_DN19136_c0_g4_i1.p1  ORF type:complete len:814 (+),score=149.91 TRINITY_DN19136_c0_g4_i1:75-2516(+)
MISYGPKAGEPDWRMLFQISGSVFPRCCGIVLPLALLAVLLKALFNRGVLVEVTAMTFLSNGSAWGGFSGLVNFVVVFRLSAAFSTYWSAYSTTTAMLGDWSGAAASVVSFCRQSKLEPRVVEDFLQTAVRLFSMLSACALQELSPREYAKLWGLQTLDPGCIDVKSLAALDGSHMRVDLCYHWIQQLIVDQQASGVLAAPPPIVGRCLAELSSGMGKFGSAKKHATTQFNFCYAQATKWLLIIYSMLMPLMMVQWSDWVVGAFVFTFLQLFFIWALDTITVILESPFDSSNPNSIDMFVLQRGMNSALLLLLDPATRAGPPTLEKNSAVKGIKTSQYPKVWVQDYEELQRRDTVHKAALKVEGWQIQDDVAMLKVASSEPLVYDVETGQHPKTKCAAWCRCCSNGCRCCSKKPQRSEIAVCGRYNTKRFGVIDGEKTAALPVGIFGDKLLVAVPRMCCFRNGIRTELKLETKSGSPGAVIIKAIPIQDRHKLHKERARDWAPGDYKEFAYEYTDLVTAVYNSRHTYDSIPFSKVTKLAEMIVDEEIEHAKAADQNAVGIEGMVMLKSYEVFCTQLVDKCGVDRKIAEREWFRRKALPEQYDQGRNDKGSVTIELDIDKFIQSRQNQMKLLEDAIMSLEDAQSAGFIDNLDATIKKVTTELPIFLEEELDKAKEKLDASENLLARWRALDEALQDACAQRDLSRLREALRDANQSGLKGTTRANAEDVERELDHAEVLEALNDAMASKNPAKLESAIQQAARLGMEADKQKAQRVLDEVRAEASAAEEIAVFKAESASYATALPGIANIEELS